MDHIRLGIIGLGKMGLEHLKNIADGHCPRVKASAFADPGPDKLRKALQMVPEAQPFTDAEKMLDSGAVDAALICVPHYLHPEYAAMCFRRGIHVMTEKPAGVYTRQVRMMNDAAKDSGAKFAIMFNQRTDPLYSKAREIVAGGLLGAPKRLVWIVTDWYRTQAYYDSGSWRGTWSGEGGGVLLNQAPHNLDLWQWIFGMPKRVRAFCTAGKYHDVGVEDDVTIYGEYENGATAVFISSTGEAPGTNRLEISGTLGKIVIEDRRLKWWRLYEDERHICFNCSDGFAVPGTEYEEFSASAPDGHPILLNNFADAILDGTDLIAPGEEGLNSLCISNAAYLSSWTGALADIPVDEAAFEEKLAELCEEEKR